MTRAIHVGHDGRSFSSPPPPHAKEVSAISNGGRCAAEEGTGNLQGGERSIAEASSVHGKARIAIARGD